MLVSTFFTVQKMKFLIKDFFSKCDQIPSFLRIWAHLLKKSLIKNFIFCAETVYTVKDSFLIQEIKKPCILEKIILQ